MQLPSIKGVGQQQRMRLRAGIDFMMGRVLTTATGLRENDSIGVDFTKALRCLAESHLPLRVIVGVSGLIAFLAKFGTWGKFLP